MSDIFSSFDGGGGDGGGGGGSGLFGGLFGGGGGGSDLFSNLAGGDPSSIINSLGGMGMGAFDPSQGFNQSPQSAAAQGGDPSGQLKDQSGDGQGQQGQGQDGQGQGKQAQQAPGFLKLLTDALKGNFQKPGYNPMGGGAPPGGGGAPAGGGGDPMSPTLPQLAGAAPGSTDPNAPTSSTSSSGPAAPEQQPTMEANAPIPPQRPPGMGPNQSPAAVAKGGEAGQAPGQAFPPGAPVSLAGGTPTGGIKSDDPRFGTNKPVPGGTQGGPQGGGAGQQQGQIPPIVQQIMGMLLPMLMQRMGPMGQMLAPMLNQLLAGQGGLGALAGNAGYMGMGPRGMNRNPEYPAIDRGRDMWNRAMPGGAAGRVTTGNRFTDQLLHIESNSRPDSVSKVDRDSRGLTLAQGGNPDEISGGAFQIQNHGPRGTWQTYAPRAGVNGSIPPRKTSFQDQYKVAKLIPVNQWGPNTKRLLHSMFGAFDERMPLGKVEAMFGGGGQGGGGYSF